MKPFLCTLFVVLGALAIEGCGQSGDPASSEVTAARAQLKETASGAAPWPATPSAPLRSVVRHADLAVRVPSVEKAEKKVGDLVESLGGYIDRSEGRDLATDHPTLSVEIKVPTDGYERCLSGLEGMGVRLRKATTSDDVTAQLVAYRAQMSSLTSEANAYREERRQAGASVDSFAQSRWREVQRAMSDVAAQRRALGARAALSAVTLSLEQDVAAASPGTDPAWLAGAWGQSTTVLLILSRSLLTLAVWVVVFAPVWVPLGLAYRWFASRGKTAFSLRTQKVQTESAP